MEVVKNDPTIESGERLVCWYHASESADWSCNPRDCRIVAAARVLEDRLCAIAVLAGEIHEAVLGGDKTIHSDVFVNEMTLSAATETVCTLVQQIVAGHGIFDDVGDETETEGWSLRLLRAFAVVGDRPQVSKK